MPAPSTTTASTPRLRSLPALRIDAAGQWHIDMRQVAALAFPLILNSTIQAVLNLTDTWFIGRLSVTATAAMASVHWLVILALFLIGGVAMGVQTLVAQAHGAGRYRRASQAGWLGLWAALLTLPLFLVIAVSGHSMLSAFGLGSGVEAQAAEYWGPRLAGGPIATALWAVSGYFNGIGRTRIPLLITLVVASANVALNEWLIFGLDLGIAGAGWATTLAQLLGVALGLVAMLKLETSRYQPRLTWRPRWNRIGLLIALGVPMAMTGSADIGAAALFQLMQVRIGIIDGAATQIVMICTSLAYLPGIGLALAGTTLVGQAIGAGNRDWAGKLGDRIILIVSLFMGGLGVLMASIGHWLVPAFVNADDPNAAAVIMLSLQLMWIAAAYQFFDGLNFASSFCLRGAGDVRVPAILVLVLAVVVFLPLTHMLSFAPGQGWIDALPAFGLGALGGWIALLVYVLGLGFALSARWRQGAWRQIRIRTR